MQNYSYLLLGGDKRQNFLYDSLKKRGLNAEIIFKKQNENINDSLGKIGGFDVIILPIPSTSDGINLYAPATREKIPLVSITERIKDNSILFTGGENAAFTACKARHKVNLLSDEPMTLKNAMATAEATLAIIIKETERTIFGQNIIIIGFGRIGKILADYLKSLRANVTICARKEIARTEAKIMGINAIGFEALNGDIGNYGIIINTVPSPVLGAKELDLLKKDALIIDLASKPGGVDFAAAKEKELKAIHALSLPGKYSPRSAAIYIEEKILKTLVL